MRMRLYRSVHFRVGVGVACQEWTWWVWHGTHLARRGRYLATQVCPTDCWGDSDSADLRPQRVGSSDIAAKEFHLARSWWRDRNSDVPHSVFRLAQPLTSEGDRRSDILIFSSSSLDTPTSARWRAASSPRRSLHPMSSWSFVSKWCRMLLTPRSRSAPSSQPRE